MQGEEKHMDVDKEEVKDESKLKADHVEEAKADPEAEAAEAC